MPSTGVRSPSPASAEPGAPERGTECRLVATAAERETHFAIRAAVFVHEQSIFPESDRDQHDDDPGTLHVLGLVDGRPVGAVRLYPLDVDGLWQGDRLAVLDEYRRRHLGGPLVRYAVRAAAHRGGRQMVAYVQPPNVMFFQHLGWRPVGEVRPYAGRPHQRMVIDLEPWRRSA